MTKLNLEKTNIFTVTFIALENIKGLSASTIEVLRNEMQGGDIKEINSNVIEIILEWLGDADEQRAFPDLRADLAALQDLMKEFKIDAIIDPNFNN